MRYRKLQTISAVLGRIIVFMVLCAVTLAATAPWIAHWPAMWTELAIGAVTSTITFALTVVFVRFENLPLSAVGAFPNSDSPRRLLMGFAIGLVIVTAWAVLSAICGYVRWKPNAEIAFVPSMIALLAYLALACREELAFHGYPLRRSALPLGIWGSQLFVAAIFALEHRLGGWNWARAILGAGVGSLAFGMASLATRGLAIPIGIHAAFNFGQWLLGLRGQPGIWRGIVEPGNDRRAEFIGAAIYVVLMATTTIAFWIVYRRTNRWQSTEIKLPTMPLTKMSSGPADIRPSNKK